MKRNGGTKADTPVRSHEVSSLFSSESRSSNKKRGRKRRRGGRKKGGSWTKVETNTNGGETEKSKGRKSERKLSFPSLSTQRLIPQIEVCV